MSTKSYCELTFFTSTFNMAAAMFLEEPELTLDSFKEKYPKIVIETKGNLTTLIFPSIKNPSDESAFSGFRSKQIPF